MEGWFEVFFLVIFGSFALAAACMALWMVGFVIHEAWEMVLGWRRNR